MFKLNRTTEYSLMALRHMSRKHAKDPLEVTSAREISDFYGLPFEITAKTLLRLKDSGLLQAAHGAKGGYTLHRSLGDISLAEFLDLMEGQQSLVACSGESDHQVSECEYEGRCEIKSLMGKLNQKVIGFLSGIPLADLIRESSLIQIENIQNGSRSAQ
jgi:Rrf2 family protein